jgi:short-subunit dehydrogenase
MTRGSELRYFADSVFMQDAVSCARDAINAFQQRESLHVPGALNRLELLLARLVPRRVIGRVTELAYRAALSRQ